MIERRLADRADEVDHRLAVDRQPVERGVFGAVLDRDQQRQDVVGDHKVEVIVDVRLRAVAGPRELDLLDRAGATEDGRARGAGRLGRVRGGRGLDALLVLAGGGVLARPLILTARAHEESEREQPA